MRIIAITICTLLIGRIFYAQDIHFSQYDVNVTTLNPAYTGVMEGDFRVANNYRNQWGTVSTPFTTFSAAYDMNVLNKKQNKGLSDIGIGLGFFSDKIGTSSLSQNQFNFSLSAIQQVNFDTKLSLGLQGAYNQQSISMDNLTWDTQFSNHQFNQDLPSQELFSNSKANYIDINAGLLLVNESWDNRFTMGVAAYHINSPKRELFAGEKLAPKLIGHASYEIKLGRSMSTRSIIPKLLYTRQRKHQEILVGAVYRNFLKQASKYTRFSTETFVDFGMYYRVQDAIVLSAGMHYQRFRFAVSYDTNISKLSVASNTIGGFEVSLAYHGLFADNRIKLK
ncbi:MAG: PorP/SprF family type IX secretion system membrane protein [Flavobacteriales bacterium]|jgi:type IX secretion system PorP/SprF family membrane protein|nr:PorP/SprF family type IX secretion system membrane protein [Flavobacteriales bacterium]